MRRITRRAADLLFWGLGFGAQGAEGDLKHQMFNLEEPRTDEACYLDKRSQSLTKSTVDVTPSFFRASDR
jgi:hypothetical protein